MTTDLNTQWTLVGTAMAALVLLLLWLHERQERLEWERLARKAALQILSDVMALGYIEEDDETDEDDIGEDVEDAELADGESETAHGSA